MSPLPLARRNKTSADNQPPLPTWGPAETVSLASRVRDSDPDEPWDLVVVGAGITGAGIARDAAMRGLRVLVLDANDIAFGTSSRSSRLIHGGVRYLEQGQIGLVYEALRERHRLKNIAPHLVTPAQFLFPAYRGDRLPLWKLRIGLSLYDALSLYQSRGHQTLGPKACREREPLLAAEGLSGAVSYEDGVTDDARLTLTTLQSARRYGAEVLTYAPVVRLARETVGERDLQVAYLRDETRVFAQQIIVAAGPWTSERLLGDVGKRLLSLSRGIHVVMRADDVPVRQPLVIQVPNERRILFVIPWGTRTYLGTTDTAYEGDPADSSVTADDRQQLYRLIGRLLPSVDLSDQRLVSSWSGVRPLVRSVRSQKKAASGGTVELSRKHRVVENAAGILAVVGGKLTTYRAMAQEAVDLVMRRLGRKRGRCETHRFALVAGEPLTAEELKNPVLADLVNRHGPEARELARQVERDSQLGERLVQDLPYRWVEVRRAITHEGCTCIRDILRRRLPLALTDHQQGARVARQVATELTQARGGSSADIEREIAEYRDALQRETGCDPPEM